ncbi:MAG: MBL fold metallo-hydrolase [Clostridia bacterium]|nr:MBL fold metallo-hydrolase [Clostridia bacterium]
MLGIKRFVNGILGANTYIIWEKESLEGCIIDVGNAPDECVQFAAQYGIKVKYIILTHAHYDHVLFLDEYVKAFPDAVTAIHSADDAILDDPRLNCSLLFGSERRFGHCQLMLEEGSELMIGNTPLKVLHTPGHTEGSICIIADGRLLSGDTLFYDSYGRTDLGCGDIKKMAESLTRLFKLPDEWFVYPGHGTRTSIGREKLVNQFFYSH